MYNNYNNNGTFAKRINKKLESGGVSCDMRIIKPATTPCTYGTLLCLTLTGCSSWLNYTQLTPPYHKF